ncbi:glycosyltransferase family 2 protein [Microbulbifer sp. YPW1]|uniref:glycosyltransferase family 2 protein n=1 Tax=Microbulbifer sp. YPW1 TaxID=2745199 RepID=UPI001598629B|nr:glycosyltransferase family 2 protein [Microbulbifer sp. YPW1]QKX16588.1 glycosyltransferase family 2 protein [Microbulbifer sp. YPW1]
MIFFDILLTLICICILVLASLFLLEVAIGAFSINRARVSENKDLSDDFIVLMPAHNEALIIEETLAALRADLGHLKKVYVIADNCSDNTADIARSCGAQVIERNDSSRRGKGYALSKGIEDTRPQPEGIIIVLDADCYVEKSALPKLAAAVKKYDRPVQANYQLTRNSEKLSARISQFAWRVKNYLRPSGLAFLGLPCQLMGTGMAFQRAHFSGIQLGTDNIVEDMQLGIDLAVKRRSAKFLPEINVWSPMAATEQSAVTQRTRWEHGHLSTIFNVFPRTFMRAVKRRDLNLLTVGLDIAIPPVSLLLLVVLINAPLTFLYTAVGGSAPLLLSLLNLSIVCVALLLAWFIVGRGLIDSSDLLKIFPFFLKKLTIYIRFFMRKPQKDWVRTDRA